jgi:hypothetical protein
LGPEAVFERGQICNRCEKDAGVVNIFGARLRPVTNLGKGPGKFYWEGLPLNKHTGKAESKAFLCPGCVFPACAHNQEHQDLEYVNGQFQATNASRSPTVLPTPVPEGSLAGTVERNQELAWGDSSDDSDFIPRSRRRKADSATRLPKTPLDVPRIARETRNVQFDTPLVVQEEEETRNASAEYTADKATSSLDKLKLMDAKHKVKGNIDKTWTAMVPMFAGKYGDIKALASFSVSVRDALRREELFVDCVGAGIPLAELLHRLLVIRLEPSSVIMSHLRPVWDQESWRAKHFADLGSLMKFLIKYLLDKTALGDAEVEFTSFRRQPGESGIDLVIRLRESYETASLADDFPERIPEHMLPERLVRSLDTTLQNRVTDGLSKSCRPWRRDKLERENRTSPDQVRMILTKVQQEIDTQLSLWPRTVRPASVSFKTPPPARTGIPMGQSARARWNRSTPFPRKSESAFSMQDGMNESEYEPEATEVDGDQLRSVGNLPRRPPTPSKPPVGLLGPPVPPAARYPRGPLGPRPPVYPAPRPRPPLDDSQRGRFTLGDPNYSGCHNCGDKQHMSRDCTLPLSQKLAALVESHTGWPEDDVQSFLEQGLPAALEECWDDPEQIRQYCLAVTEWRDNETATGTD